MVALNVEQETDLRLDKTSVSRNLREFCKGRNSIS
nr:MAG TPA: hypothetical protein [Caudoviricetes sp.]